MAKSVERGKFRPHISEIPWPILMKLEIYNHRWKTTHHAERNFNRSTWVVWTNTQFATVGFLCLSFFWFLSHAHRSHQWTDFDNLCAIWRFSGQGCAFWGLGWYVVTFRGSNAPKPNFGGLNRHFQAKRAKYEKLHIIKTTTPISMKFCTMMQIGPPEGVGS